MKEFQTNTAELNQNMSTMLATVNQIASAISESSKGVSSTAEETSVLTALFDNISAKTSENKEMASVLKEETKMFQV